MHKQTLICFAAKFGHTKLKMNPARKTNRKCGKREREREREANLGRSGSSTLRGAALASERRREAILKAQ